MAIFLRHSWNVKPLRWGSAQDVQYAIRVNSEKIYGIDPDNDVLIMPGFWGLPPLDYSGYNNHGTNHGTTYKDGSLDFDGDDDNIDLGSIPAGHSLNLASSNLTVSFGLNWDDTGDSFQRIIDKSDGGVATNGYSLYISGTGLIFSVNGQNVITTSSIVLIANTWKHITVIHINNSATGQIFSDGVEASYSSRLARIIPSNTTNMRIGTWNHDVGREYNGTIDEVRISNVARTADQIALFHDRPWDLYRPVSRVIYSIPAAPTFIPQIIMF